MPNPHLNYRIMCTCICACLRHLDDTSDGVMSSDRDGVMTSDSDDSVATWRSFNQLSTERSPPQTFNRGGSNVL